MLHNAKKNALLKEREAIRLNNTMFRAVQQKMLAEKEGDVFNQEQYAKLLKPITDTQKDTSKDVIKALKEYAPAALAAPALPAIEAATPETTENKTNSVSIYG
jgi:hypothetical protein